MTASKVLFYSDWLEGYPLGGVMRVSSYQRFLFITIVSISILLVKVATTLSLTKKNRPVENAMSTFNGRASVFSGIAPGNASIHPKLFDEPSKELPTRDIPVTVQFWPSFFTAFVMIVVSELGDKTFLIAAIMAMRHSRIQVGISALAALAIMTIVSATFGLILPNLLSKHYTRWAAAILFVGFGIKMIVEGLQMSSSALREEYDEVSHEIDDSEEISRRRSTTLRMSHSLEAGTRDNNDHLSSSSCHQTFLLYTSELIGYFERLCVGSFLSPVALQAFTLTFLAEWGDRSQIATIALAAAQNVYGVASGAIAGHAVCTILAVVSGRLLASLMSIRTVTIIGGLLFLLFALLAIL